MPRRGHHRWLRAFVKLRVKFVWGASRVVQGRWYLGLFGRYDRAGGRRGDGLAISVRGVLLWLLALGVVLYFAAATALFWIWQRNPYSILTYGDAVTYPFRRAALQEKRGRAYLAQGMDLSRAGKHHDAAKLLRLGLARHPRDFRARQILAQYHVMTGRRPAALHVLTEGLAEEYPGLAYLELLFNLAEQGEDYETVITTCERYGPGLSSADSLRDQRWLLGRHFNALGAAGRWEEALALVTAAQAGEMTNELRVLALLELNRPEAALTLLDEWRRRPGAGLGAVLRLRIRALREAERFEEMVPAIREFRARTPADPAPAAYGVVQLALAARESAAQEAFNDFLFRFAGTAANLRLLAEPLAEIGDMARLRRCVAAAAEHGFALRPFHVLLVQALVKRGEWSEARELLAAIEPATGREELPSRIWRDWIERIIDAASTPLGTAQLALLEFLRERPWPIQMYRRSIEVLTAAGRIETAREVIAVAGTNFPASFWVQSESVRVGEEIASREQAVLAATSAAAPPASEREFVAQLDALLGERRWGEADQLVRGLRGLRPVPAWLPAQEHRLRLAQLRISQGEGDTSAMIAAARLYLGGGHERIPPLLAAAQEFFAAGDKDGAIALVREVLRGSPGHAPAELLLRKWLPPPPKED